MRLLTKFRLILLFFADKAAVPIHDLPILAGLWECPSLRRHKQFFRCGRHKQLTVWVLKNIADFFANLRKVFGFYRPIVQLNAAARRKMQTDKNFFIKSVREQNRKFCRSPMIKSIALHSPCCENRGADTNINDKDPSDAQRHGVLAAGILGLKARDAMK